MRNFFFRKVTTNEFFLQTPLGMLIATTERTPFVFS